MSSVDTVNLSTASTTNTFFSVQSLTEVLEIKDLAYEIFSHLTAKELLPLTLTCKNCLQSVNQEFERRHNGVRFTSAEALTHTPNSYAKVNYFALCFFKNICGTKRETEYFNGKDSFPLHFLPIQLSKMWNDRRYIISKQASWGYEKLFLLEKKENHKQYANFLGDYLALAIYYARTITSIGNPVSPHSTKKTNFNKAVAYISYCLDRGFKESLDIFIRSIPALVDEKEQFLFHTLKPLFIKEKKIYNSFSGFVKYLDLRNHYSADISDQEVQDNFFFKFIIAVNAIDADVKQAAILFRSCFEQDQNLEFAPQQYIIAAETFYRLKQWKEAYKYSAVAFKKDTQRELNFRFYFLGAIICCKSDCIEEAVHYSKIAIEKMDAEAFTLTDLLIELLKEYNAWDALAELCKAVFEHQSERYQVNICVRFIEALNSSKKWDKIYSTVLTILEQNPPSMLNQILYDSVFFAAYNLQNWNSAVIYGDRIFSFQIPFLSDTFSITYCQTLLELKHYRKAYDLFNMLTENRSQFSQLEMNDYDQLKAKIEDKAIDIESAAKKQKLL